MRIRATKVLGKDYSKWRKEPTERPVAGVRLEQADTRWGRGALKNDDLHRRDAEKSYVKRDRS